MRNLLARENLDFWSCFARLQENPVLSDVAQCIFEVCKTIFCDCVRFQLTGFAWAALVDRWGDVAVVLTSEHCCCYLNWFLAVGILSQSFCDFVAVELANVEASKHLLEKLATGWLLLVNIDNQGANWIEHVWTCSSLETIHPKKPFRWELHQCLTGFCIEKIPEDGESQWKADGRLVRMRVAIQFWFVKQSSSLRIERLACFFLSSPFWCELWFVMQSSSLRSERLACFFLPSPFECERWFTGEAID